MKKVEQAEDIADLGYMFAGAEIGQMVNYADSPLSATAPAESCVPDTMLAWIKFLFLYVPGAAALHLLMFGFGMMARYGHLVVEMIPGLFTFTAVSTFMIMLGIGKFSDLRYLRVVGAMAAVSSLSAFVYAISSFFIPGDFFSWSFQLSFPLTLLAGYLAKRHTDKVSDRNIASPENLS